MTDSKAAPTQFMRAAVVHEHGGIDKIVLEDRYPRPLPRPGWVVLRVRATSLNFHDIFSRRGMPGIKLPLPVIIGSDIAGDIVDIGPDVTGWTVGERVLVDPTPCEGTDFRFVGEQFDGGRAEFCAVHATQLVSLPSEVSHEVAASIPLAYATAYRMMFTRGNVQAGETVLVLGASGGVGTACVMLAKLAGAKVIACAGTEQKAVRLREIGADDVINYRTSDMREAAWGLVGKPRVSGSGGVDMAVNFTGGKTWKETLRCLKLGGRLVTCGATAGFDEDVDVRYVWTYEQTIIGSDGWRRGDIEALIELARTRKLVPIVDKVLPLDRIHEAERFLESREAFGKIVIVP